MKLKLILLVFLGVFFLSCLSSALVLPPIQQFSCGQLLQNNNGTFANITGISYPNGTVVFKGNIAMTKNANWYNYTFCNTSDIGTYQVQGFDDDSGNWGYPFYVTATGTQITIQQGILYSVIFGIALFFFLITLGLALYLPSKNKTDEMTGYIIAVENLKYLRYFCWCIAYLMIVIMLYFSWHISYDFLNVEFLGGIFRFAFYFFAYSTLVLFPIMVYVMIANKIRDDKVADMLLMGLRPR